MLSGVLSEARRAARRNALRHGPVARDQLTVRICQADAGGKREKAAATWQQGADGGVAERKWERCYSPLLCPMMSCPTTIYIPAACWRLSRTHIILQTQRK